MYTVVVDFETSGYSPETDHILSAGYVAFDSDDIHKEDFQFLKAGVLYFWQKGWTAGPTEVHGLTEEFLSQYEEDYEKNCIELQTLLYGAHVVYYAPGNFDYHFYEGFAKRHNFKPVAAYCGKIAKQPGSGMSNWGALTNDDIWTPTGSAWYEISKPLRECVSNWLSQNGRMDIATKRSFKLSETYYAMSGNNPAPMDMAKQLAEHACQVNVLNVQEVTQSAHQALYDVCMTAAIYLIWLFQQPVVEKPKPATVVEAWL